MVDTVSLVEVSCVRLALGMIASLLVLDPTPIPPRFFRVQFLVVLGLIALAACFVFDPARETTDRAVAQGFLATSAVACFLGCVIWHLDKAPSGRLVIWLTTLGLALVLAFLMPSTHYIWSGLWLQTDNYASAAMLGFAMSAMLLGHSYLISPTMTIAPLRRMLAAGTVALALRVTLACWGLYWWTDEHPLGNLERETLLWLIARWLLGILAPVALGWMAWETARIRSTQSATGILYVVVIVTFLGELTSLLLLEKTGFPL